MSKQTAIGCLSRDEIVLYLSWLVPIIEVLCFPSSIGNITSLSIPFLLLMWKLVQGRVRYLINTIPFLCLLSPLSSPLFGVIMYSELALTIVFILALRKFFSADFCIAFSRLDMYVFFMFSLFILSYLLSFEYGLLWKGFINGIYLMSAFIMTKAYVRNLEDVVQFSRGFVIAVTYAVNIMIAFYIKGVNLNDLMGGGSIIGIDSNVLPLEGRSFATYFYTGIFYVISSAIVLIPVFLTGLNGFRKKIIIMIVTLSLICGLISNFNKTSLIAVGFVLLLYVFRFIAKGRWLNVTFAFILVILSGQLLIDQNKSLERGFSDNSLLVRLQVYKSALNALIDNPVVLATGLGPESASRLPENKVLIDAKESESGWEGQIDSAHITYVFEYGIFFFIAYVAYGLTMVKRLLDCRNRNRDSLSNGYSEANVRENISFSYALIFILVFLIGMTQVLSVGKIAVMLMQLFACAYSITLINATKKNGRSSVSSRN